MLSLYLVNHNYTRFLPAALKSIEWQTRQPEQIILIDNGSTDGAAEVLETWRGRKNVEIVYNENIGHIRAANQALKMSTQKYIVRLDAVDILLPHALEYLLEALETYPGSAYAFGDYYHCDAQGKITAEVDAISRGEKVWSEIQGSRFNVQGSKIKEPNPEL